jgi:hypothetical protein
MSNHPGEQTPEDYHLWRDAEKAIVAYYRHADLWLCHLHAQEIRDAMDRFDHAQVAVTDDVEAARAHLDGLYSGIEANAGADTCNHFLELCHGDPVLDRLLAAYGCTTIPDLVATVLKEHARAAAYNERLKRERREREDAEFAADPEAFLNRMSGATLPIKSSLEEHRP